MKFTMSDGRGVGTSYEPDCDMNRTIQQKYKVQGNEHAYRLFLQQNAEKIMKDISTSASKGDCAFCPQCAQSLKYKPTGNI